MMREKQRISDDLRKLEDEYFEVIEQARLPEEHLHSCDSVINKLKEKRQTC